MTFGESEAQLLRGLAPLGAFLLGLALERLAPHVALRPAWRANLGLWLIDAVLLAIVCGACGFAIAAWATQAGVGLLNELGAPLWLGIPVTVATLDFVSYGWHRANHEIGFLWRFIACTTRTRLTTCRPPFASTRVSSYSHCRSGSERSSRWARRWLAS